MEAVLDLDASLDALRPVAEARPLARGGADLSRASERVLSLGARRAELLASLDPRAKRRS